MNKRSHTVKRADERPKAAKPQLSPRELEERERMFSTPCNSVFQACSLLLYLHLTDQTYHPEDSAQDIINSGTGKLLFNRREAAQLNRRMGEMRRIEWSHYADACDFLLALSADRAYDAATADRPEAREVCKPPVIRRMLLQEGAYLLLSDGYQIEAIRDCGEDLDELLKWKAAAVQESVKAANASSVLLSKAVRSLSQCVIDLTRP